MQNSNLDDLNQSSQSGHSSSRWNLASPKGFSKSLLSSEKYRDLMRGSTNLLENGQSLSSKLQAFIGNNSPLASSSALGPSSPTEVIQSAGLHMGSGQQLKNNSLQQVTQALERQEQINHVNAQLSKLNYLVNIANFRKHKQVEMSVQEGQRQLQRLNSTMHDQAATIEELNNSLSELSVEMEQQRNVCKRLTGSLDSQRHLLDTSLLETRREMGHQHALLAKQQRFLDKLIQQKLRQDFLVDGGLIVTAIYLSNTILVNYPLQLLLSVIPKQKQKLWVHQLGKLIFIIKMVMFLRYCSIRCGLHNSVGCTVGYGQEALRLAAQRIRHLVSMATRLFQSRKDSKLDIC
ncbi:unnamed protein product [Owenia fusiformis]|uniref:Uncharacterized protein n=1 Tax=Owenia fusiformis TaxID=6347 RepID=A0A8J1THJ5_OWEFU|nr:unnamed protein product [Owenia fusiformis]